MNIDHIKQKTSISKISHFSSIDSTNSYLLTHGDCGEVCISDTQSNGRGRRGNVWLSPNSGNLYFSLCWCFEKIPTYWSLLGLFVGVVIAETLESLGLKGHGIKWPNDIFWQQRKMGGILIETVNQSGKVVIGIGLNLKMSQEEQNQIDQAVVTLEEALNGESFVKEDVIIQLIIRLNEKLKIFGALDFKHFTRTWERWDILYDQVVMIKYQGLDLMGQIKGIDSSGRLKFKKEASDEILFLSSAEIILKSLNKT